MMIVLCTVVLSIIPLRARAFETCEERAQAWIDSCPHAAGHCLDPYACPPGLILLHAGCEEAVAFDIELGPASASAFRTAGPIGVSPIGEFPEWGAEPAARRAAFDAVWACARNDPSLLAPAPGGSDPGDVGPTTEVSSPRRSGVPWRLVFGLFAFVCVLVARRLDPPKDGVACSRSEVLGLLILAGVTLALRTAAFGTGFFHENGQGPLWIATALDPMGDRSHYGPGYWELYSKLAVPSSSPESGIFWTHAVLGALCPVLSWVLARVIGARAMTAWLLALIVASNPVLGWVFGSESYYATWFVALLLAALVLALGLAGQVRVARAVPAVLCAGLIISQAARVVPVGWVPAALLPLVVVAGRGRAVPRLVTAGAVGLLIGAIVAASSGATMLSVLDGYLGDEWMGRAKLTVSWGYLALLGLLLGGGVVTVVVLHRSRPSRSRLVLDVLALAVLVVIIERSGAILERYTIATRVAYWSLGLLTGVAVVSAIFRDLPPRFRIRAQMSLLALGVAANVLVGRMSQPMTDTLELRWFLDHRYEIPPDARVYYMGQAERMVLHLPLYPGARLGGSQRVMGVRSGQAHVPTDGRPLVWVRTSLCATPELARACREFEAQHSMVPLVTTELAARCFDCEYVDDPVRIGIYRIASTGG